MAHRNIPIFIPHLGCPNQCVFCNQRSISGCQEFHETEVAQLIETALSNGQAGKDTEIAFFGGSFTGIDRALMLRLLDTAEAFVREGRVGGIRLSTRPDYINDEILGILSRYSVHVIELGLQSMDDSVLVASHRGHNARAAADACRAVVNAGFTLVGQMMIGLPNSTAENELETAERICQLGATACRIYPTVVFHGTPLCEMVKNGTYTPLTLKEAVVRSAAVLRVFESRGVSCIRLGLHATESLTDSESVMGGPNHPALGELVRGELAYLDLLSAVEEAGLIGRQITLRVPWREVSRIVGHQKSNLIRLERETDTRICKTVGEKTIQKILIEEFAKKK